MKPKPKESKEKERRALYDAIKGRLSEMRGCLKSYYMDPKIGEVEEDIIHGINKGIHDIEHIFFDLLLDDVPAKEILENSTKSLGTRIIPVRYRG
jgi:hypothetical protein